MAELIKTNLIVNYLPQNMTDTEFQSLFESIGPIVSCRIIRDRNTGYSYGFGFVEYQDAKHAEQAISILNGYKAQHKTLKVSYSRPGGDKIKNTNLYVGNLPKDIDESKLESTFKIYGNVIQSRILRDSDGVSRGIGFVRFNIQEEAQIAIDSLNNKPFPGTDTIVSIRISTSENEKKQRDMIQKYSKVKSVASNKKPYPTPLLDLDPSAYYNKPSLFENGGSFANYMGMNPYYEQSMPPKYPLFDSYNKGGVEQFTYGVTSYNDIASNYRNTANLYNNKGQFYYEGFSQNMQPSPYEKMKMRMPYPARGPSMGFAAQPPPSYNINSQMPMPRPLSGATNGNLAIKPTIPPLTEPKSLLDGVIFDSKGEESKLFVYNIGNDTNEKEITNLFWPYGTVLKVDIPRDAKNALLNKGFAFVLMSNAQEASLAIQYLNNFAFKDKALQVSIKKESAK